MNDIIPEEALRTIEDRFGSRFVSMPLARRKLAPKKPSLRRSPRMLRRSSS
jgi:hypothetical protein